MSTEQEKKQNEEEKLVNLSEGVGQRTHETSEYEQLMREQESRTKK